MALNRSSQTSEFLRKVARHTYFLAVTFEVICIGQHVQIFDQIINELSEFDQVLKDIQVEPLATIEWE
jgi:GMP synthase PP-ATPase subunit